MSTGKKSPHAGSEGPWAGVCGGPPHCHIPSILLSCLMSRLAVQESGQKVKVLVYTYSCSQGLKAVSESFSLDSVCGFFPCCGFADGFFRGTAVQFCQHCNFSYKHSSMYFIVGFVVTTCHRNIVDHLQLSNKLDCIHHPFLERPIE